ncbi:hypothetical protein KY311_00745, partial [Candidatus Woesearchaeota archaeon]|nr:hypothetical protein [Candidatus Woesearchaeota archaeon]
PDTLRELNNGQTFEDLETAIRFFHKYGINIHGMWILGTDSDTISEFKRISRFNRKNNVDYAQYNILTPLPGTATYRELDSQGRIFDKDWSNYDSLHVVYEPKNMAPHELQWGMLGCYGDFYSYAAAVKCAIRTGFNTGITAVKKMFADAHFRSINPPLIKLFGRRLVNTWIKRNREYLASLRKLSTSLQSN